MIKQQFKALAHFLAHAELAVQMHLRILCPLQPEAFKLTPKESPATA